MKKVGVAAIIASIAVMAAVLLPACSCSSAVNEDSSGSASSSSASSSSAAASSAASSSSAASESAAAVSESADAGASNAAQGGNAGTQSTQSNDTAVAQSSGNTGGNTASQPAHVHNWVPVTETRIVVDQEAWDEPVTQTETHWICNACGDVGCVDGGEHMHNVHYPYQVTGAYRAVTVQLTPIHHEAVTHTEDVVIGYRCSECGATK